MADVLYSFFCEDIRTDVQNKTIAIGMWGQRCRFPRAAPGRLRTIAYHAFVANPERRAYHYRLTLEGVAFQDPIVHEGTLPVTPNSDGHAINMIYGPVEIAGPGAITGTLLLEAGPDVRAVASLDFAFDS